ncbi:MAG: OmpA family protein [Elusimicrobiaceae bacterium]|nr:OmpA family protein [Elusimicrobiaceae bacterium]
MKNLLKVVLVLAVAAGLTACSKNKKNDVAADGNVVAVSEMVVAEENVEVPAQEVALGVVHFALDKATLSADNRKIVEANAQAIKAAAGAVANYQVIVEGNCDDRGTTAYNIALGQKRADEVKAYYVRLGIPADKIATVSYGEEKPVCYEANNDCWAQNRRADTLLQAN